MKHRILRMIAQYIDSEIIEIELIAENKEEEEMIKHKTQEVADYLTFNLDTIEIIEDLSPKFIIRKAKDNIGFGN